MIDPHQWMQLTHRDLETRKARFPHLAASLSAAFYCAAEEGFNCLEQHMDYPHDSSLFANCSAILQNEEVLQFFQFAMRLVFIKKFEPFELQTVLMIYLETQGILERNFWGVEPFLLVRDAVIEFYEMLYPFSNQSLL